MSDKNSDQVTSVWTLKSDHNPYLHNPFTLLRIDPDEGLKSLLAKCSRLSRQLEAGIELKAYDRTIKESDVARAHHLTANAEEFIAERLLTHTVHAFDQREFEGLAQAIEAIPFDQPSAILPLPIRNLSFLTRLLPDPAPMEGDAPQPISPESLLRIARPDNAAEQAYDL